LQADDAEPILLGENAIFRLPGKIIARIARPGQQAGSPSRSRRLPADCLRRARNVTKGAHEPPAALLKLGGILTPVRRQVTGLSWEDWTI
jgi:hypothetical protein